MCSIVAVGEQLLELVDHHQQLRVLVGEDLADGAGDPAWVVAHHLGECTGLAHGDAAECRFELLEGVPTGQHRGDEPVLRASDRPGP